MVEKLQTIPAFSTETSWRNRIHGPHGTFWINSFSYEGSIDGKPGSIVPLQRLLGRVEHQRVPGEAFLGQFLLGRTKTILVSASMVGSYLPGDLR